MLKKSSISIIPLILTGFAFTATVDAGTVIKIQDQNEITTMLTDGKQARINMSAEEYVIIDLENHKVKMVTPASKQVMVFDTKTTKNREQYSTGASRSLVKLSLKKAGKTKNIAGYPSKEYIYSANGRSCGIIYSSKEAMKAEGVKELLDAMQAMINQQRVVMGGFARMIDDCKLADMQLTDNIEKIGMPMQKEESGRITTQVKSIEVDVALPADIFVVPASYKNTSIEEQIQQAYPGRSQSSSSHHSKARADQQAQMQNMMKQMQQSGQLTPEVMQQMQHVQELMQQYK